MAECSRQDNSRGWCPESPRLTMQGLQSLRLAMQKDMSSTAPASSNTIATAHGRNEFQDPWTKEQSVRRSNTRQWVQQQQSQCYRDSDPIDSMSRLEETPQTVQQANFQAVSPQLSQEEKDAEERARPENEINSQFGSDAGLGIYEKPDEAMQLSSITIMDVRKAPAAAAAAAAAAASDNNVHDHNDHHNRFERPFSSANTTAVDSIGSKSGNDALIPDVIRTSKIKSRSRASSAPSTATSSAPPSALGRRHRHGWKCMCSRCCHQRDVDAVVGAHRKPSERSAQLGSHGQGLKPRRCRHGHEKQRQRQRQAAQQMHSQQAILAPLVLETISIGVRATVRAVAGVVYDAENYITELYAHEFDNIDDGAISDDAASEDEAAIQHSEHPRQRRGREERMMICPAVPLTALRTAVGVLLCAVIWLFARVVLLVGPEQLFGVCLVSVLILVGHGHGLVLDARHHGNELTAKRSVPNTGRDGSQSGRGLHLSCTSHGQNRSRRNHGNDEQYRLLALEYQMSQQQRARPEQPNQGFRLDHPSLPDVEHNDLFNCSRFFAGSRAPREDHVGGGQMRKVRGYSASMLDLLQQSRDDDISWAEMRSLA